MAKPIIPVFYSCDEKFLKYCMVSLYSLLKNAKEDCTYLIYILHTDISPEKQDEFIDRLENIGLSVSYDVCFEDVTENLNLIEHEFPLRDYYSKTTS